MTGGAITPMDLFCTHSVLPFPLLRVSSASHSLVQLSADGGEATPSWALLTQFLADPIPSHSGPRLGQTPHRVPWGQGCEDQEEEQ